MSGLDAQLLSEVAGLSDSPVQCMHLGLGGWGLSEVRHLQKPFVLIFVNTLSDSPVHWDVRQLSNICLNPSVSKKMVISKNERHLHHF